jgi:threonine dehydratase
VLFKREDTQPVFSFKLRGAYNKIAHLTAAERAAASSAASAGNHAQGVAFAARKLGLPATIVMPQTTPEIKVDAVKSMGATVVLVGDSYADAQAHCDVLIAETGMTFVHPFDDPLVIAGQGTVGAEILRHSQDALSAVFVPVGGGGPHLGDRRLHQVATPGREGDRRGGVRGRRDVPLAAGRPRVRLDTWASSPTAWRLREVGQRTFRDRAADGGRGSCASPTTKRARRSRTSSTTPVR